MDGLVGVAWTPGQRNAVVWGGLLVFLIMTVLERAIGLVFLLNFSPDGPNASVALLVLLIGGLMYPLGLSKKWPHGSKTVSVLTVACIVLLAVTALPIPIVALSAAILWLLLATPLSFTLVASLRRRATMSLALALALRLAINAWTGTLSLYSSLLATMALLAIAGAWGATLIPALAEISRAARRLPNPAPVWAFAFAGVVFLGSPGLVASWTGDSLLVVQVGALAGTAAGAFMAMRGSWAGPARAWEGAALIAAGAGWVIWGPIWPAPGIAVACLGAILASDSALDRPRHGYIRRHGLLTALVQVIAVIFLLLHVAAANWAFVPGGSILAGQAGLFLFLLVVMIGAVDIRRRDWGAAT